MNTELYRYNFAQHVPFEEIEASLVLAIMAAESLHGSTQVRLETAHTLDSENRRVVMEVASVVGRDLNRLFLGFISREFGEDAFQVERVNPDQNLPQEAAA